MNEFQFDFKRTLNRINIFGFPLGILLSTCTKLRIEGLSIGIGEIILSIVTIISLVSIIFWGSEKKFPKNIELFYYFWFFSFILMAIGAFFGFNLIQDYVFEDSLHDLFSYIFTSIVITISWGVNVNTFNNTKKMVNIYLFYIFLYFILILTAILSPDYTLFGTDFSFGGIRISGLSENPNQLACFCEIVPFLIVYQWKFQSKLKYRIYLFLFLFLTIFIGFSTLSDGLILSWSVAGGSCIVLWYLGITPLKKQSNFMKSLIYVLKFFVIPTTVIFIVSFVLLNTLQFANDVFDDGGQGSDRISRWENGIKAVKISPIFGFGAGSYSGETRPFEKEEAHNSLIDWTLSTGIVGLLLFLGIMMLYFKQLFYNRFLFCAAFGLLTYIMFGYFLRHPFFWFNIILLVQLAANQKKDFISRSQQII